MQSVVRFRVRATLACRRSTASSTLLAAIVAAGLSDSPVLGAQQPREPMANMNMSDSTPDMMMTGPLGISTDRQGSGTSWVPEAVLMPFRHALWGKWDIMSHWNVFGQVDAQRGPRGDTQVGSINWSMVMASRPMLGGRLQLRAMNSIEAATVGRCGYPALLQTGETCRGVPNHDRQHPHDFFMEAAALYERAISRSLAWSVYVAPSGEPASGPVAFMHRPSAMNDPMVNISHHWQDATHITFGVVTGAVYGKRWKLEGSAFNGREPDENRWNFDLKDARLGSRAGRLTVNPSTRWSVSASYASIDGPEPDAPDESMNRATASVLHARPFATRGRLAAALVWGANRHEDDDRWEPSVLAEANVELDARNSVLTRVEYVRKSSGDLVLDDATASTDHALTALSLGYVREIGTAGPVGFGVGARGTVTFVPDALRPAYGSTTPTGLVVFLRMRAKPMTAAELAEMHERMRHAAMGMKME
jgi:hypothetical protein